MDRCDCKHSQCESLRAELRGIFTMKGLADCTRVNQNTTAWHGLQLSGILPDSFAKTRCWIAKWHYPPVCFDDNGDLKTICVEDPDKDKTGKYALAKYRQGARQSQLSPQFVCAPCLLPMEMEQMITNHRRQVQDIGRDGTPSRKTQVLAERLQELHPSVVEYFEANKAEEMKKLKEEFAHEVEKMKKEWEKQIAEAVQTKTSASRTNQNHNILHIPNLCYEYLNKQDIRILKANFGFTCVDRLFGFVHAALILFDCKDREIFKFPKTVDESAIKIYHDNESQSKVLRLATKLTPWERRELIQNRSFRGIANQQAMLLTMINRRMGMPARTMATMVTNADGGRVSYKTLERILQKWIPRLGLLGRLLCSFPVPEGVSNALLPNSFINSGFEDVFCVVDCRDVLTSQIRINATVGRMMYSNKAHSSAGRVLVMAHPCGLVMFLSEPVFARCEEMTLFRELIPWLPEIPASKSILADRAYTYAQTFLPNHNRVQVPETKPRNAGLQFSISEISRSKRMSQLRYVVEVVNSRSASWKSADHITPRRELPNLANSVFFSYGISIFLEPLQQPSNRFFISLIDALCFAYATKKQYIFSSSSL